jgi:hypothetical protein
MTNLRMYGSKKPIGRKASKSNEKILQGLVNMSIVKNLLVSSHVETLSIIISFEHQSQKGSK